MYKIIDIYSKKKAEYNSRMESLGFDQASGAFCVQIQHLVQDKSTQNILKNRKCTIKNMQCE